MQGSEGFLPMPPSWPELLLVKILMRGSSMQHVLGYPQTKGRQFGERYLWSVSKYDKDAIAMWGVVISVAATWADRFIGHILLWRETCSTGWETDSVGQFLS